MISHVLWNRDDMQQDFLNPFLTPLRKLKHRIAPRKDGHSKQTATEVLFEHVAPYTLCETDRLSSLLHLGEHLNAQGIEGDFVECGTYKGGAAAILSKCLTEHRHLWLYDSFEGLPATSERDGEDAKDWIGKCVGSIEDVQDVMTLVGTQPHCYTIRKGWFHQSFQEPLPEKVALLHCDADWYDSVTIVLDTFYQVIAEGGCIILDDFGYWEGCREAFYDFCRKYDERPLIERIGSTQAYWIKGKRHNRT